MDRLPATLLPDRAGLGELGYDRWARKRGSLLAASAIAGLGGRVMRNVPIAALAVLALAMAPKADAAEPAAPAAPPAIAMPAPPGKATQVPPNGPPIVLQANKGTLIRLQAPATTVFVADANIADVTIKTPGLIYVTAKTPGETALYAVDGSDHVLLNSVIRVEPDLAPMRQALQTMRVQQGVASQSLQGAKLGDNVSANWINKTLVVSGTVATIREAEAVRAAAATAAGAVPGSTVIDRLSIATPNQVYIRVKIAEVDRTVSKALGINLSKLAGQGLTFNANIPLPTGSVLSSRFPGSSHTAPIQVILDMLASEGLVKTLAEPNLTVSNNETAEFTVGGNFFFLIQNPGGIGNTLSSGSPFGTRLAVTPTIIDAAHIKLQIAPSISSQPVAAANSFTETATQAKTTVELGSGQTFALAGLIQDTSNESQTKVPLLGDIPVVGQLFRSEQLSRSQSEVVILVTPFLVEPSTTRMAAPTDGLILPHDAQQIITGGMYRQTLPGPAKGPTPGGGQGPALVGPVGFRLD